MISKEDRDIILYLMGEHAFTNSEDAQLSYISNLDQTIRWIYPKYLKRPMFLNFYGTASFRAKIFCGIIQLAFFLKQSHRVKSGDLKIQITDNSRLDKILKKYDYSGFSIFTGTLGENRKALLEIHNYQQTIVFVKIALGEKSKSLVNNEINQLQGLNKLNFKQLVVPSVLDSSEDGIVELSNIKPYNFQQSLKLKKLHIIALAEIYRKTHTHRKLQQLSCFNECKQNIRYLSTNYEVVNTLDKARVKKLSKNILLLIELIETDNETLPMSMAHGDFTPWNMYSSKNILYLFDWELSKREFPILYDLIHYVFQSEIMIKHSNYNIICSELESILKMRSTRKIIRDFDVDVNKHYVFYLFYTVSYYLNKYVKQEQLHEQVFWLMDTWEEAVDDLLKKNGDVFN